MEQWNKHNEDYMRAVLYMLSYFGLNNRHRERERKSITAKWDKNAQ